MHAFLSNIANRQTDRQTKTGKTFTSSFVGGKNGDMQWITDWMSASRECGIEYAITNENQ